MKRVQPRAHRPKQSVELLRDSLRNIAVKDPQLQAVRAVSPEVRTEARRWDLRLHPQNGLSGLPILIKDNIETAGAISTTGGSLALLDHHPGKDAFVVRRLREAHALVLGKTNLSEWAASRSSSAAPGWSPFGQTKNAVDPTRSPSGSSSGSAVAVRAGYVHAALGTETLGSLVGPASANGVVGFKPTVGLLSRSGIIPTSFTQDTPGPLSDTVLASAQMVQAMAGEDSEDAATCVGAQRPVDFLQGLSPHALKGVRLGVVTGRYADYDEGTRLAYEAARQTLVRAGAILVPVEVELPSSVLKADSQLLLMEQKQGMNDYLREASEVTPGVPKNLEALIAFNAQRPAEMVFRLGQDTLEKAAQAPNLEGDAYQTVRAQVEQIHQSGIEAVFRQANVSAVIAPTAGPAQPLDPIQAGVGDRYRSFAPPAAIARLPHLTVPMGTSEGLPVGLSFVGPAWSDAEILAYGYAFEQASLFGKRKQAAAF